MVRAYHLLFLCLSITSLCTLGSQDSTDELWLTDPVVVDAQAKLESLKDARRAASAKLELDVTAQLGKNISAAERELAKATKRAKKAFKKGGAPAIEKAKEDRVATKKKAKEEKEAQTLQKVADIKRKLKDAKNKMHEAGMDDDFEEAARLQGVIKDLESKKKKLEL